MLGMNTRKDFKRFHPIVDVIHLADVFENFVKIKTGDDTNPLEL